MTLSARIAVGPSRRLLLATAGLSAGGVIATAATAAARWPEAVLGVAALACVGVAATLTRAVRRHRKTGARTLVWSHHADIAVIAPNGRDDAWRLFPPTMTWSGGPLGLSVVALEPADGAGGESILLAVLDADLGRARRAWNRRLLWALRGGAAARLDGPVGA